jgi:hypothetical protein
MLPFTDEHRVLANIAQYGRDLATRTAFPCHRLAPDDVHGQRVSTMALGTTQLFR